MTKKFGPCCGIFVTLLLLSASVAKAQSFIRFSKYAGGASVDSALRMEVVAGETYLLSNTTSAGFTGTINNYAGKRDLVLSKYNTGGALVYARYIGGSEDEYISEMAVVNGEVFLTGITYSADFPVTNAFSSRGESDIFITRINTSGAVVFSTLLGGSKADNIAAGELQLSGNELYIAGTTNSADFPATNGSIFKGGTSDGFVVRLNSSNGSILQSNFIGGNGVDQLNRIQLSNGALYLAGNTQSPDLPVTIGSFIAGNGRNAFVYKLQAGNLQVVYNRYLGGNNDDFLANIRVQNNEVHLTGYTSSSDYPVTNGSSASGLPGDGIDGFYTRLNTDGSIGFSGYLSTSGLDIINYMWLDGSNAYSGGVVINSASGIIEFVIHKISGSGQLVYTKKFPVGTGNFSFPTAHVVNGELYITGTTNAPDYPVTNQSQFHNGGTGYFTRIGATGNIIYSSFLGKMNSLQPSLYSNNKFYLLANTGFASFPVSDSSTISGGTDNMLLVLNEDGSTYHARYTGGSSNEYASAIRVSNNDVFICGKTISSDYPVTDATPLYYGAGDAFLTKLSFCATGYDIANDVLSPSTQTVCRYGLANTISGKAIAVPGSNLPVVYYNGIAGEQRAIGARYQWQSATSPSGPWTAIAGATLPDYTPVTGGADQYFRRLSFSPPQCGSLLVSTSAVAAVLVNASTAPVADAGGPFVTCPGSSIVIGGTATATGGTAPYTYTWDMGAAPVANPSVNPGISTIYTVTVSDAAGCRQMAQAIVLSFAADAGPDKSTCANAPVTIGTAGIPGVAGIRYSWTPNSNISNATIAQPSVNPAVPTAYELALTVTKTGGGTCTTKDTVNVQPVAAPVTADFAGPDRTICLGETANIGTPSEPGFTYTWSPGSYLSNNIISNTTYSPGNILMPEPNPAIISLTAQKDGCSFTDQVTVSTIEARAGKMGCGPRLIGMEDRTPNINETYQWVKLAGPGNFTGVTNQAQVPVSASVGGKTDYLLIVAYQGHVCTSQVTVTESCEGCEIIVLVDAQYECPGYDANFGNVTLTASSSLGDATFTWSPQQGLSNYTGSTVKLTDNVPRTYTIRATSIYDPTQFCERTLEVNNPAYAAPVFPAPDVTGCANTPISIGLPPVSGYTYEWEGNGLLNNYVSNPTAIVAIQTSYPVKVTDANGCQLKDTVTLFIQNVNVDAGADWIICSNGIATLGTPAMPNTTYQWEPAASPWQNGTNQNSAQPQVLAVTDITFTVTAATSAGCISTDEVSIVINNSPTIPNAPDVVMCKGTPVTIGSPALPGVTYQWTPATGLNNPNIAQPEASPLVNTTYTLLATFPGNCALPATDQVTVRVSDPSFSMPDINFCPGAGSVALGTAAPAGMSQYIWYPSNMVTNPVIANPSTLNPPPTVNTDFILTVINTDGCVAVDTFTIIPAIVKPVAGDDKTICKNAGTTIGSPANATGPGISYSWSPAVNLSNAASPMPVYTGTTGGTFQYILTKTDNGCTSKDTVLVTVIDSLIPAMAGPVFCQNSCAPIGTTPVDGLSYQWTPAAGLSNAGIANPVLCVGTTTQQYTLTATNGFGCSSSVTIVAAVQALPAANISIPALTACAGDINKQFNPVITPAGNYSYLWTPDDGTLSSVTIANPFVLVTGAGTRQYNLQVTDNTTGCSNNVTANLVVSQCTGLGSIGDFMWFDDDNDGLQGPEEIGVSNRTVTLYNSLNFAVATTLTDANGFYSFTNISAGSGYYIVFSKPNGYAFTTQYAGGPGAGNNSKADATGRTAAFSIAANEAVQQLDAGIVVEGTVPVTLLSFTGQLRQRQVWLNWQTTAEYNNHYFDVERSTDLVQFAAIGRVSGHGTTVLPHSYSLADPNPATGTSYYRLKQVDFDGTYSYSDIVTIHVTEAKPLMVTYQKPANSIKIVFDKKQPKAAFKLFAANGQLIAATAAQNVNSYEWKLPKLAAGVYMLQVISDGISETKRLLIAQ